MSGLVLLIVIVLALWALTRFYLGGENLSRYDRAPPPAVGGEREPSAEHHEMVELLKGFTGAGAGLTGRARVRALRESMDRMGDGADLTGITIEAASADGVPGEWVLADGARRERRLLYLHGGAFSLGSPRSHRVITSRLARLSGMAVFAVDYRLMPEHRRLDCLTDCQTAYRWILGHGPGGAAPLDALVVAGDSAGGNLTLAVIAWARDAGLRPADAAIALSPATDATFTSPSLAANVRTDHMLGPAFGMITKLPRSLALWFSWLAYRVRPSDPRVSPVRGDLAGLPPTLVHASEAEMLLDDARRYVNKATAAGSEATLETWHHMLHVWHAFDPRLPEAREAFEHVAQFLAPVVPEHRSRAASH